MFGGGNGGLHKIFQGVRRNEEMHCRGIFCDHMASKEIRKTK